jgi:iron complex transport system substrate-binding protein
LKKAISIFSVLFIIMLNSIWAKSNDTFPDHRIVKDALNRKVKIPTDVRHIICSGSGSLRLISYMQANDLVVGVDEMEKKNNSFDARDYAIANPEYRKLPLIGGMKGLDNPELILNLNPQPDVIFKVYSVSGFDPVELQRKTGIPVIVLKYGDLGYHIEDFFNSLTIIGKALNRGKRADELISFVKLILKDLTKRTENIPDNKKSTCYVGGVAYNGPHGLCSTEPAYSPFKMLNVNNVAFDDTKSISELAHASISREKLLDWDPEIIFIDLATMQTNDAGNALYEINVEPIYKELKAVKSGNIYGLLPYNYYSINFESVLANAYYIGKLLYPEEFRDISPAKKADVLYRSFVGKPIFSKLNKTFGNKVFKKL